MEVADDAKDLLTKIGVETSLRWVLPASSCRPQDAPQELLVHAAAAVAICVRRLRALPSVAPGLQRSAVEERCPLTLTRRGGASCCACMLCRYAIQLISAASLIAQKRKAAAVGVEDVSRAYTLFLDVQRSVQYLQVWQEGRVPSGGGVSVGLGRVESLASDMPPTCWLAGLRRLSSPAGPLPVCFAAFLAGVCAGVHVQRDRGARGGGGGR